MKRTKHDKPIGSIPEAPVVQPEKRRPAGKSWNRVQMCRVHELRTEGEPWEDIARRFKSTVNQVRGAYHRWRKKEGINGEGKGYSWTEDKIMDLAFRKRGGQSDKDIGKAYGYSERTIIYHRRKNGIDANGNFAGHRNLCYD